MSEPDRSGTKLGCLSWLVGGVLGLALLFLFLLSGIGRQWLLQLPYHLIAGCVLHAKRAFAHFAADLPQFMRAAVLPCLATVVALWGAHRLILWWRLASGKNAGWHFKHTALAGSLVLLGAAAAIALSGILHETAWLPQGKIIQSNISSRRFVAINNAQKLGMMLNEHESEHDTYPSSLLDLEKLAPDYLDLRKMVFVDLDKQGPPEPFVFLKPRGEAGSDPNGIVLIGPQMPDRGDFVVLKADYSVTRQPAAKFVEVVKSAVEANANGK